MQFIATVANVLVLCMLFFVKGCGVTPTPEATPVGTWYQISSDGAVQPDGSVKGISYLELRKNGQMYYQWRLEFDNAGNVIMAEQADENDDGFPDVNSEVYFELGIPHVLSTPKGEIIGKIELIDDVFTFTPSSNLNFDRSVEV